MEAKLQQANKNIEQLVLKIVRGQAEELNGYCVKGAIDCDSSQCTKCKIQHFIDVKDAMLKKYTVV